MTVRGQARRSSPTLLLPMIRPLLDDPGQDVRDEAVGALRRCGAASGQFSGELSGIAARYPQTAGRQGYHAGAAGGGDVDAAR